MTREDIYKDIEETFGLVPTYMKTMPEEYLEEEWELTKKLQLSKTNIPNKYKELMGLALSAATRCRFCSFFHTEAAKAFGATDEEIEEAVHFAKLSIGWSTYIHGMQVDYEQFKNEVRQAIEYMKTHEQERAVASI